MSNSYVYNTGVRITGSFTSSGAPTDPTTVTLKIKTPAGIITSYTYASGEVTKSGTGEYYKDFVLNQSGTWYYYWQGTGAVVAADEEWLSVKDTVF